MSKFAPYPEYASTSVGWLNEIPSHWRVKPLWSLFRRIKRTGHESERLLSVYRDYGVIPKDSRDDNHNRASEDLSAYQLVEPGDLAINKMKAWQGSVGISSHRGIVSPAYFIFKAEHKENPRYIHHLMRCNRYIAGYQSISKGIRVNQWDLDPDKHARMPVVLPPSHEQQAIVDFLDRETARIDTLIAKKTRFIELLKEKILARIIASTSPRYEWDEFPFWRIARTKSISGRSDENLLSVYLDRGVIPYSEGGGLVHKPADSLEKYQLVELGDLVMNNQQAWRGSLGVSPHRGIVSPAYLVFSLDKEKIDPSFANYAFRSGPYVEKFMLASMSVGDIQRQLKWPHLRKTKVSVPSLGEQRRIASELDLESKRISSLISKTERSIELLKEHRSALITAAVTGKIDVREAA